MLRLTVILSGVAILMAYQPVQASAKIYYVGTCKPGKADYTTIQEAVTGVPPGSTINVCAGTYPEQVAILQPLTLQGAPIGNNSSVLITAPSSGVLAPTVPVSLLASAQVAVSNSGGPVNISGITVDGTGVTGSSSGEVAGILYNSSPGTLNRVVVQNLAPSNTQVTGVLVRDDNSVSPTDEIENSVISLPNSGNGSIGGINVSTVTFTSGGLLSSSSGTITANILNNYVVAASGDTTFYQNNTGIETDLNVAATITGNTVTETPFAPVTPGVFAFSSGIYVYQATAPIKINGNTVLAAFNDIGLWGSTSTTDISNNVLAASWYGIQIAQASGATIKGNQIVPATINPAGPGLPVGINFACIAQMPTVSGNNFLSMSIALLNVPSGSAVEKNAGNFTNVPTVEQLCP
jgi:parallel beta-helix repeat protein